MNGNVIIKSFPNGISVRLSDKADFEKILQDTRTSFEKTASFFKNASIVLRFEGRELSDDEIEALTSAILEVSQINIICVVCTNQEENTYFSKSLICFCCLLYVLVCFVSVFIIPKLVGNFPCNFF